MVPCVYDSRKRADSAVGTRQCTGLADHGAAVFLSLETLCQSARVNARDGKNVIRAEIVQIQPEHEFSKKLNRCPGCYTVVVQSRRVGDRDFVRIDVELSDQELLNTFRSADRLAH